MRHADDTVSGQSTSSNGHTPNDATAKPDNLAVLSQLPTAASAKAPVVDVRDYAQIEPIAQASPRWLRRYTLVVLGADMLAAALAALVAVSAFPSAMGLWIVALFPPTWIAALGMGRTYEHRFVGNGNEEYKRLFHVTAVFLAVVGTIAYAMDLELTRGVVVVGFPLAMTLSLVVHFAARQGLHRARRRGDCMQRVVVVGLERSVAELIRSVRFEPNAGLEVVGVCIDRPRGDTVEGVPVMGDSDHVLEVLMAVGGDTVAVTSWSDVSQTDLRRLSWDLEGSGVSLLVAPRLTDISGPRIHVRPVAGLPLLNVEQPEFTGVRRVVKGATDRIGALLGIILLSPILIVAAFSIRLSTKGPVLFRQTRVGRHGKTFVMHKFRTMHVDAEHHQPALEDFNESDGVLFKMRQDPRITTVGRWMRRYSIDELPQLFDVLLGRMSLVGPRPPLPQEVAKYAVDVRRRLIVKPGITGLWQVSGRSDLSWDESVRLDLLYVENWSLALDLAIMMKTVLAVFRGKGAY